MHTLLSFSNVFLVMLASFTELSLLRRFGPWSERRRAPFFVLALPLVSLGLSVSELHHFIVRVCFLGTQSWDQLIGMLLPLGVGGVALGGLGLGVLRLALMARVVARRGTLTTPALQLLVERLAKRRGTKLPEVRLCVYDRPLAFTCGLWRPVVLLSTWMLEQLDQQELEAVLAHELEHVARRDYLVIWLATVLRDAFWYMPTSRAAYRQLQAEKELACDERASAMTKRPLALASALAKVWHHTVAETHCYPAQPLVGVGEAIDCRIERLLNHQEPPSRTPRSRVAALGASASALLVLLLAVFVSGAFILAAMGCGPVMQLWQI